MNKGKIPVIYILSNVRSGSTVLDLLLGSHPRIWTLGEVQNLPWVLRKRHRPCGCGRPVEVCHFWRQLLPEIPLNGGQYRIGYFFDNNQNSRQFRWHLLTDLTRGSLPKARAHSQSEYSKNNLQLFEVVWNALQKRSSGQIRWMVDASKNPNRLYWLQQSQRFDFRIIRLVRDVRGFANSVTRPDHSRKMVLLAARRWLVNNFIFVYLCKRQFEPNQVFSLRYSELASQPEPVLKSIGNWLGLEFPENTHKHFRQYENHAIAGNMTRWKHTEIYLDEKWKQELPALDAFMIHAFTWPFSKLFGF